MKTVFATVAILCVMVPFFAQRNVSIDIEDDVYNLLETCQARGLCPYLIGVKPYTQQKILDTLKMILDNGTMDDDEIQSVQADYDAKLQDYKTELQKYKAELEASRPAPKVKKTTDEQEEGTEDTGTTPLNITEANVATENSPTTSDAQADTANPAPQDAAPTDTQNTPLQPDNALATNDATTTESPPATDNQEGAPSEKKVKKPKKPKKPQKPFIPHSKLSKREIEVIQYYIDKFTLHDGDHHVGWVYTHLQNQSTKVPLSFEYNFTAEAKLSGGVYTKSEFDAIAFDFIANYDFSGDISKYFSYRLHGVFDLARIPLYERGDDYLVGYSWYDEFNTQNGTHAQDTDGSKYELSDFADEIDSNGLDAAIAKYDEPRRRVLRKKSNTAYLPFTYFRKFGGQVYYLENLQASGLEGWPTTAAITFAITADMRASFLDNKVVLGIGRIRHEWGAMDRGSSLILSDKALPFFAFDCSFEILPSIKFSSLVGILEYPNQDYIADQSWPDNKEDDSLFQNAFSINMLEFDWRYFHFDFGSSVVWPKRFEIGYMFPLINYVVYQNHLGDNDNCALFANIKFRKENLGAIWGSIYLDEINGLNNNPFTSARAMYAGQLGIKFIVPKLPFTSISFRYTKVEPFCYTHHSINYTPWYDHYICENYTNGGDPLGYYLPPNADEFFLRFETMPVSGVACNLQYQFIRHGADYGSQQVQGSSLYSELTPVDRDSVVKTFLHDGAYNWMHIISVGASYSNRSNEKIPFQIYGNVGFIYSYYTMIDGDEYEMSILGNHKCSKTTEYHFVDNKEYPVQCGAVITVGVKLWKF